MQHNLRTSLIDFVAEREVRSSRDLWILCELVSNVIGICGTMSMIVGVHIAVFSSVEAEPLQSFAEL